MMVTVLRSFSAPIGMYSTGMTCGATCERTTRPVDELSDTRGRPRSLHTRERERRLAELYLAGDEVGIERGAQKVVLQCPNVRLKLIRWCVRILLEMSGWRVSRPTLRRSSPILLAHTEI